MDSMLRPLVRLVRGLIDSPNLRRLLGRITQLVVGILIAVVVALLAGLLLVRQMIAGLMVKNSEAMASS